VENVAFSVTHDGNRQTCEVGGCRDEHHEQGHDRCIVHVVEFIVGQKLLAVQGSNLGACNVHTWQNSRGLKN
jgi:hypothetical protein